MNAKNKSPRPRRFPALAALVIIWLFVVCMVGQAAQPLTILHWNDFHAQNLPWRDKIDGVEVTVGGAAYFAGLLDSLRGVYPGALALHAGDEFTGTPISSITQGKSQIEILNRIMPEAFELGNHEFDYGWANLQERMAQADFPLVCCNVVDSVSGQPIARPSLIVERNGVKIAIIGVMTRHLAGSVLAEALPGLKVEDPVPLVNQLLDELEKQTDMQIALTHQGVEEDQRLAEGCPRLEVIVGGHRHARLFEPLITNGVPILQAGDKGEYLGVFQAQVDTAANRLVSFTGQLLLVRTNALYPRQDIEAWVKAQEATVAAELDKVVGVLAGPWVRSDEGESNVGDWTADAMLRLTGRDLAFINSGGLRRDLPAGQVKVRDLWEVHPFGNRLLGFQLSGEELHRAISFQATNRSRFLQVGGLRYRARGQTGEILELTVAGKPLDPTQLYSVVTNEYVLGHADRYFGFGLGDREITDLGWIDRDLVLQAFKQEREVEAVKDGRIVIE